MKLSTFILNYEIPIRLSFFFGVLIIMGLWEVLAPRRALTVSKLPRWTNNLGIVFLNSLVVRLLFPMAGAGVAAFAVEKGWGIFNQFTLPPAFIAVFSILFLDFVIYLQHVLMHAVPALWRLHRVHHADVDYDVTTGARFHPIEIVLSMLIKFSAIVVLGPPVASVIVFEVLLNATAMFNHSNIALPLGIDRILRRFVVTPDMHRVHHSIEDDECNSNFGFNLPWWDRVFGTYAAQPRAGHENMTIGIRKYRDPKQVAWLPGMLTLPFVGNITAYAINRRAWDTEDSRGKDDA
ncbi:MAG: sterol desaturase family protein [Nitrospiria bacterium]